MLISDSFSSEELLAVSDALMDQSERLKKRSIARAVQERPGASSSSLGFLVMLTTKEKQILNQVICGDHNKEIAAALSISRRTVESHITNMLSKTGLSNRTQLARWAIEHCDIQVICKSPVIPFHRANERMRSVS